MADFHPSQGNCPLNHLHFHGFSWPNDLTILGQPLVLHFHHDRRFLIDKIWVAKLVKCYLRKQTDRTLLSENTWLSTHMRRT
jgi:hypothetical protein